MKSARSPRENTNHNISSRWKKNKTIFFLATSTLRFAFSPKPCAENQSITLISTLRFSISPHARLNSFHSNVTKCCACHENCKDRITKCCACHENCKDRITKCCTCHENCKDRITKCCACHESCKDRITKCCACHANCKDRITKENSPKWIGWMEARWMGFSFWINIYHSWYLPWRQKQALFLTWKRASEKAAGTVGVDLFDDGVRECWPGVSLFCLFFERIDSHCFCFEENQLGSVLDCAAPCLEESLLSLAKLRLEEVWKISLSTLQ